MSNEYILEMYFSVTWILSLILRIKSSNEKYLTKQGKDETEKPKRNHKNFLTLFTIPSDQWGKTDETSKTSDISGWNVGCEIHS